MPLRQDRDTTGVYSRSGISGTGTTGSVVEARREIRDNMTEDERQCLVGAVSEAQVSLSEVAFKLRREVTPKAPALKAALPLFGREPMGRLNSA